MRLSALAMWLILTLAAPAASAGETPHEDHSNPYLLLDCGFESDSDRNYDSWPDYWTRQKGAGFPTYLPVRIVADVADSGCHSLHVALNGGAAALFSPSFPVTDGCEYALAARVRTKGLSQNVTYVALQFLNGNREVVETRYSQTVGKDTDWTDLVIAATAPRHPDARAVRAALCLMPQAPGDVATRPAWLGSDLTGEAWFDGIVLRRCPRIELNLAQPRQPAPRINLLTAGERVEVAAHVHGLATPAMLRLELLDVAGKPLGDAFETPLTPPNAAMTTHVDARHTTHAVAGYASADHTWAKHDAAGRPSAGHGTVAPTTAHPAPPVALKWALPDFSPGYFVVRATLNQLRTSPTDSPIAQQHLSLLVVEAAPPPRGSRFGWSLNHPAPAMPVETLADLAGAAHLRYLKFPAWNLGDDAGSLRDLHTLAQRLTYCRTELVGLVAFPPPSVQKALATPRPTMAQLLQADSAIWEPSLAQAMEQTALAITQWQLGADDDLSLSNRPTAAAEVEALWKRLAVPGLAPHLGAASPPASAPSSNTPWQFTAEMATGKEYAPAQSSQSAGVHLAALPRWLTFHALPRSQHPLEDRAADLVRKMAAAHQSGADAVFLADPLDVERGLIRADGAPGELFLTWRVAAQALAGSRPLGKLEFPGGIQADVFLRDDQAILLIWGQQAGHQQLALGAQARQLDLWGRPLGNSSSEGLTVAFGPHPTWVVGADAALIRTITSLEFGRNLLPSARQQFQTLSWQNGFPADLRGKLRLSLPESWRAWPHEFTFELAAGARVEETFALRLPQSAVTGAHLVRVDFELRDGRKFSVFRRLQVGETDLTADIQTRTDAQGRLTVTPLIFNTTGRELPLRCSLYAPGRARQTVRLRVGKSHEHTFTLGDARDLTGLTLWLRIEEVGGERVISRKWKVGEQDASASSSTRSIGKDGAGPAP